MFKQIKEFLFGKPEVAQPAPYKIEPPVDTVPRVLEAIESKPATKTSPTAKKPATPKRAATRKSPATKFKPSTAKNKLPARKPKTSR